MWCDCVQISSNNIACLNIPYNSSNLDFYKLGVDFLGTSIEWDNPDIEDAFFILKEVDDIRALTFTELSISNGGLVIDIADNHKLEIRPNLDMQAFNGNFLYYELYIKELGKNYIILRGKFLNEKTFR